MSQEAMRAEWEALNKKTEATPQANPEIDAHNIEIPEHRNVNPGLQESLKPVQEDTSDEIEKNEPEVDSQEAADTSQNKPDNKGNFKRLREKNEELERRLWEMEERIKGNNSPKEIEPQEDQDSLENLDIADSDLAEGRHLKKQAAKIKDLRKSVKDLNEAIRKNKEEQEKLLVETKLRSTYPDIFSVVNEDNLKELREQEPEIVRSLLTSNDIYAQHVTAYKLIKKYGIGNQDPYINDKIRAQKNLSKPRTAASISPRQGESPLAEADRFQNGLTPDLQRQLYKEMEDAISNR